MHDKPEPQEILAAASEIIRGSLLPALPPELAFNARVLANALDLVARQITEPESTAADDHARLSLLLGEDGPEDELTAELARRLESRDIPLNDRAVTNYLWHRTLAKLAVDQPRYPSYRAETQSGNEKISLERP